MSTILCRCIIPSRGQSCSPTTAGIATWTMHLETQKASAALESPRSHQDKTLFPLESKATMFERSLKFKEFKSQTKRNSSTWERKQKWSLDTRNDLSMAFEKALIAQTDSLKSTTLPESTLPRCLRPTSTNQFTPTSSRKGRKTESSAALSLLLEI